MADVAELKTSLYSNLFSNRAYGGTSEPGVADHYVSGFGYFFFDRLPAKLHEYVDGFNSNKDIQATLMALTLRVNNPTETLNKTTTTGIGGKKWSSATNIDVADTMTIAFLEVSGTPIKRIISGWINMIRDIRSGMSQLTGKDYTKSLYSAAGLGITTKPDGLTIETAEYFTGMFPQKNPFDSFNLDVATNEKVEIDIDFNVDNVWSKEQQPFVIEKAKTVVSAVAAKKNEYLKYSG